MWFPRGGVASIKAWRLVTVVAAAVMFAQGAGATTVSIAFEQSTGTPPVEEVPFPAMSSGSFSHFETTSIPGVQTSPYSVDSSIPYSVLDKGGGIPSSATYNIAPSVNFALTMLWGSPSASDQVQFFSGVNGTGQLEGSFTGADLMCDSCNFSLVTFAANGGSIGSMVLSDSGPTAFEYDIAEDPFLPPPSPPSPPPPPPPLGTPLPGALPLFLDGLAALGLFVRRRHK